jgi:hypothetical protein
VTLHDTHIRGFETDRSPEFLTKQAEERIAAQQTLARPIRDYDGLVAALVARRKLKGWTQQVLDCRSGVQPGYVGKLEVKMKRFGDMSFECILGALGVELFVVERQEGE